MVHSRVYGYYDSPMSKLSMSYCCRGQADESFASLRKRRVSHIRIAEEPSDHLSLYCQQHVSGLIIIGAKDLY